LAVAICLLSAKSLFAYKWQQVSGFPKEPLMVKVVAKKPRYVLKLGSQLLGPTLSLTAGDANVSAVFGFSDKSRYDAFILAGTQPLMPYPLIQGYLQNQLALDSALLRLIVVDAVSPQQDLLLATNYQDTLESIKLHSDSVPITYQLVRDKDATVYRVQPLDSLQPQSMDAGCGV
jgi:hypothetical protein